MTARRFENSEILSALGGGAIAAAASLALILGVGQIGSFEARSLIEAILPAVRFLGIGVVTGSITVLGLLLTLLGLSLNSEYYFRNRFYARVGHITTLSVVGIAMAVILLLAASVPLEQVEELGGFYDIYYYILSGGLSMLGGLIIAIGLLIGATLRGLVRIGRDDAPSDLLYDPGEEG